MNFEAGVYHMSFEARILSVTEFIIIYKKIRL